MSLTWHEPRLAAPLNCRPPCSPLPSAPQTVCPPTSRDCYSESIVYMPHSYFVNDYKQVRMRGCATANAQDALRAAACKLRWVAGSCFAARPAACRPAQHDKPHCPQPPFSPPQAHREVLDPANLPSRAEIGLPEDKVVYACANQL